MDTHVKHVIEGWARWRCGRHGLGYSRESMTGKLMSGMPGTGCPTCGKKGKVPGKQFGIDEDMIICPTCSGEGRVPMELRPDAIRTRKCPVCIKGEKNGKTCIKCHGTGRYVVPNSVKINPALIKATKRAEPECVQYETVDKTVAAFRRNQLTLKYYFVIIEEYTKIGRQTDKARRMRVGYSTYKRLLMEAHTRIDDAVKRA